MTVTIIGPKHRLDPSAINTTSRSSTWSRGLSPFHLGPVTVPHGWSTRALTANNVENAWQYSKVYSEHVGPDGKPLPEWFAWRAAGLGQRYAQRYPMGKGRRPLFSWWDREHLTYVEARKRIYIPLYASAVRATPAFAELERQYKEKGALTLWDFDGYDHRSEKMSYDDVVNCSERKMGHAFVLAMLLEGKL